MFDSVYDGDYDGVVRIFVGLSCELGRLISYLINYIIIYITWNNFSPTRSVITLHYAAQFFPYQECNETPREDFMPTFIPTVHTK